MSQYQNYEHFFFSFIEIMFYFIWLKSLFVPNIFLLCCTTNSSGTFALASFPNICSLEKNNYLVGFVQYTVDIISNGPTFMSGMSVSQ